MKRSYWHLGSSLAAAIAIASATPAGAQVTLGQIDTFTAGETHGWFTGGGPGGPGGPVPPTPATVLLDGGPGGAGDGFMRLTATGGQGAGSRLTISNDSRWAGNYPLAGVGAIQMDLNNLGGTELALRLVFEAFGAMGPTDIAFSTSPILLPASSGWTRVLFPITAADLTNFAALPGSSIADALANAAVIRLYHSPDPNSPNPFFPIPAVTAQLGVDNVTALAAVPEPSTVALLGGGLLALAGLGRRMRRR